MPTTILDEIRNASPTCEPASKVQHPVCANSCDTMLLPDGKKTDRLIPSLSTLLCQLPSYTLQTCLICHPDHHIPGSCLCVGGYAITPSNSPSHVKNMGLLGHIQITVPSPLYHCLPFFLPVLVFLSPKNELDMELSQQNTTLF